MCIFCDIAAGRVPAYTIYEDHNVMAFLDIAQVTRGHTLVIPKQHCEHILLCDTDLMVDVMRVAQRISQNLVELTQCKGIHLLTNVNEAAGQTVHHFHVHLIPRYDDNDAFKIEFKESKQQDLKKLTEFLYMEEL